jgi:glutathione synthase/RimK-type ligase-like ATP-grasp enzyme
MLQDGIDARLVTVNGRNIMLSDVKTIWWRRPRLPIDDPALDEETRLFVHNEWEHLVEGLQAFTSVRWVNPPEANRLASRKAFQLVAARAEGLRVPRTIMTNDSQAVQQLAIEGIPLIYKRLGTAARPVSATKALQPTDMERLNILCNCPAIFQERIDAKQDIRVTAMGDNLYAAEIDSQSGQSILDWRFDHTVPFRQHILDDKTSARLRALMRRLGLVYSAIDLRLTPEGEYVFLEINPSGQYLFIELLTQMPLSKHMADFLAGVG